MYDQRHGSRSLQGEREVKKVNNRSVRNGVAHSSVQEVGMDRNTARERCRGRRRGFGRGRGADQGEHKVLENVERLVKILVLGRVSWKIMH